MRTYLTQRQLADRWNVSTKTIERMRVPAGELGWMRIGGQIRFTEEHIAQFEQAVAAKRRFSEQAPAVDLRRVPDKEGSPVDLRAAARRGREIAREVNEREAAKKAGLPLPKKDFSIDRFMEEFHKSEERRQRKKNLPRTPRIKIP